MEKNIRIGKIINAKDFKIDCKGCKSKFNNFVRYCLTPDSIKWDCQNCSSEFTMYANDFEENEESTSVKISVFHKRHGNLTHKEYGLINNSDFRELIEVKESEKAEKMKILISKVKALENANKEPMPEWEHFIDSDGKRVNFPMPYPEMSGEEYDLSVKKYYEAKEKAEVKQ